MGPSPELKQAIEQHLQENPQNQGDLARECGQVPSNFSSWINGKRLGPNPRTAVGLIFYEKLAKAIHWPVGKVVTHSEASAQADTSRFWDGFNKQAQKALSTSSELSPETRRKILLIALNTHGCEEYLEVMLAGFRSYVESVRDFTWIESPNEVGDRISKKRRQPSKY